MTNTLKTAADTKRVTGLYYSAGNGDELFHAKTKSNVKQRVAKLMRSVFFLFCFTLDYN